MSNDYSKLIEAISSYYGSGSDQWQYIIQNIGTNDLGEVAKLLKQVPNVDVWTDKNGRVVNYTVNDVLKGFSASENIGSVTNSNTIPSITGSSVTANIPSIISKSATTGELSGLSGIGLKASTGTTVTGIAKTIGVGIGAVALGTQLGKILGTALYEGNPDTWDDGIISGLSNEDWNKFAISLKEQAVDGILGLFGVNGDTTTMYLDENFAGYMAWYMSENGMLKNGYIKNVSTDDIDKLFPFSTNNGIYTTTPSNTVYISASGEVTSPDLKVKDNSSIVYCGYVQSSNDENELQAFFASEKPFKFSNDITGNTYFDSTEVTINNNTFHHSRIAALSYSNNKSFPPESFVYYNGKPEGWASTYLPYIVLYGNKQEISPYNGITNNPNSKQFDPTGIGSVSTALGALKNQYPELWDNAINTKVPQEDGSEDERVYIPLPIPNFKNEFDKQPTTGTPSQSDPSISPDTTPKEELDNTAGTIAPPQTPSDNPNTGGGDSPNIILPTQQASSLWAIYNPSLSQLNQLGSWLWSTNFIDQILKIFNDPMQAIIGLHKVYATPDISGSGNIKVGYLDSGVPSNIVGNQYTYIDCGTVSLREYYGNILDYSPYTTVQLYLPFIGIVSLDIADVSRSSITVKYGVDILTGACLASVSVQRDNAGGVLYQYSGNCACQYPLSSGSYMGMVTGALGAIGSLAHGNIIGTGLSVAGMHTNIEHSGGFSGNAGAMGIKKPYLIISRPQSAMNDGFPSIQGYPSNYFVRLGNCNGFTQVAECHIENISATDKELDKIKDLLKEGVIL